MTVRQLRARLDRLALSLGTMPGQDRDRDRRRREELFYRKLAPQGLTDQEKAELLSLDALFQEEDRDRNRLAELAVRLGVNRLTENEARELAELERRYPPVDVAHSDQYEAVMEAVRAALEKYEREAS